MTACPRQTLVLAATLLVLAGCVPAASPESRFYQLSALATPAATSCPAPLAIAVGPVRLPDSLDRPQIVSRASDNELILAEHHRWAGSLREEVGRVLAENMARLLPSARIEAYPWHRARQLTQQVEVTITRLDGILGMHADLEARWALFDPRANRLLMARTTSLREPVTGPDHEALVAAQSRLLGRLSTEIAEAAIGQLDKSP